MTTAVLIGDSQMVSLMPHLTERLRARGIEVVGSHAMVGWSTRSFVSGGQIERLMENRPDVVLLALGGNDTAGAPLAAAMSALLEQIRSHNDPHIIWISPAYSLNAEVQRRHQGTVDMQRAYLPGQGVEWHDAQSMTHDLAHTPDGTHFPSTSAARWAARIDAVLFSSDGPSALFVGAIAAGAAALGLAGLAWLAWKGRIGTYIHRREVPMSLFGLLVVLVLLGVALWALGQFPAIDPTIVKIIRIVVVVIAVLVALFFLFELAAYFGLADFAPPRFRRH